MECSTIHTTMSKWAFEFTYEKDIGFDNEADVPITEQITHEFPVDDRIVKRFVRDDGTINILNPPVPDDYKYTNWSHQDRGLDRVNQAFDKYHYREWNYSSDSLSLVSGKLIKKKLSILQKYHIDHPFQSDRMYH